MTKHLEILLVEPSNEAILTGSRGTAPLWPSVLAGLTPQDHRVTFHQTAFEPLSDAILSRYDLVGISCRTDTAVHTAAIGDRCRSLHIPCVIGGIHPFFLPDEAKAHCDAVVLGEAENVWATVLDDAQKGQLQPFYRGEPPVDRQFRPADFAVVRKYHYGINNVLQTVRGCPFACSFCSATRFSGHRYRYRPIDAVLAEVEQWPNRSDLALFADLNITANPAETKALLRALAPYKLTWWGNASVQVADDDELLRLLADSGCAYLGIGFETLSPATMREIHKHHNLGVDFKHVVQRLHDHNIDVFGNFIFGFDSDTPDVFQRTVDFILEAEIDFPVLEILTPYPGTKIFEHFKEEGRLLTEDWSRYTRTDIVFRPQQLTPQALLDGLFWAYHQVYSPRALIGRAVSRWRGVRKNLYNARLLSHFAKQLTNVKDSSHGP